MNSNIKNEIISDISCHIKELNERETATLNAMSFLANYFEYYKYLFVKKDIHSGSIHSYVIEDLTKKFGEFDKKEVSFYLIKHGYFKTKHIFIFLVCLSLLSSLLVYFYFGTNSCIISVIINVILNVIIVGTFLESNTLSSKKYDLKMLKEILDKEEV